MLWIGGQVTSGSIISRLFLPSLISLAVPLVWLMAKDSKTIELVGMTNENENGKTSGITKTESLIVLVIGLGALFLVPIIKYFTHLPPYISIMGGLGLLWVVTEFIHLRHPDAHERHEFVVSSLMKKIDMPSVLFFLGILLAVAGLETSGHLRKLAELLDTHVGNVYAVNSIIGLLSSIVDNVPLVAGAMGMYPLTVYEQNHIFWELLAFCAGTGGSILIIGSAAGVATMGILKIEFVWYMKKISLLALSGYVAGIITFWLLN
jgi:Na+/H+ antiporter NhaD/arsenite permease-like protein